MVRLGVELSYLKDIDRLEAENQKLRELLADERAKVRQVQDTITKFEDGENHDEGAFDTDCSVCLILKELRTAVLPSPQSGAAT